MRGRYRLALPVADITGEPEGPRERQILLGAAFIVAEDTGGWAKGQAERDGYQGWIASEALVPADEAAPTHRVTAIRSYAKRTPGLKDGSPRLDLPFGARVTVLSAADGWTEIAPPHPGEDSLFLPTQHLSPDDRLFPDPVAISERFLGTPYLWGGNSAFGIDCSGLVQAGCHACGIPCPGDSGPQARHFPEAPTNDFQRGDLLFWKGHVAWVTDPETILHANAHDMAVAYEPIAEAIARIEQQGDGPITKHARPTYS